MKVFTARIFTYDEFHHIHKQSLSTPDICASNKSQISIVLRQAVTRIDQQTAVRCTAEA